MKKFALPILFTLILSSQPIYADDFQDGVDAYESKDFKTALEKLKPLAEQGNARAQFYLGRIYVSGNGVPENFKKSFEEGIKWYKKAAEQGNAIAQINLGIMYRLGQGVPQNYIEAHKWYNLAASRFPPGEYQETALKNQNILEKKMTPAQVAEAQKLAREWKPKPAQ